jgi:uncharacterized protein with ParB-like and HNH nuclease domain
MNEKPLITLHQYIAKGKVFEIPNYQRGYVWGKSRRTNSNDTDSVSFFINSLIRGCETNSSMFLQGVTVSELPDKIVIIDGQQRTTLLYLILLYLGKVDNFTIKYAVRQDSDKFLQSIKGKSLDEVINKCSPNEAEKYQDIYFFKKSIRLIHEKLRNYADDKEKLLAYLYKQIKFLYINIPPENAASIFTMMNGNKADMVAQEVIKADLLRLISQPRSEEKIDEATRWDTNMTRSKYAREWDKWLHWWNRSDVQEFYNTKNIMGLLIESLYNSEGKDKLSYEGFKRDFLDKDDKVKAAKDTFSMLHKLQKRFEDVFHNYELHNKIGAVMHIQKHNQSFIQSYFVRNEIPDIDVYSDFVYLGVQHNDIVKNAESEIQSKYDYSLDVLQNDNLYEADKELGFRQLLRRNVQAYTDIKQAFDFGICKEWSLEHIFPKSKKNELGSCGGDSGVHSIGNLVLLYKNDNSAFKDSSFNDKKAIYFNLDKRKGFKSRNLLHTLSVFASEEWGVEEIKKQKQAFLDEYKTHYKKYNTDHSDENA